MAQEENKTVCPTCQGKKIIDGVCETSGEWQGSNSDDGQICTPDQDCPTCKGKGYIED
ncbi:MAG: ankyrin [Desulfobulbus propionicus]|nr:MAG: ankyrin [Desulfobulbus propionicus]